MAENAKLRNKVKEQQTQLYHLNEKIKRMSRQSKSSSPRSTQEMAQAGRKINTKSNVFKGLTNHMAENKDLRMIQDKSCQPRVHNVLFTLLIPLV